MVQTYQILGKQVGSHYLAMGVLGAMFGGAYYATRSSKPTSATPPINASSPDEADFIKKFLEEATAEEKKASSAKH